MRFILSSITLLFSFILMAQDVSYPFLTLDKNLKENANAVVRLDEMTVTIPSRKEMNIKLKRVVTVLNKYGNKHAHTSVGYNNSIKVKNIEAKIYNAFGKEIDKIKKKAFKDVSAVDGGTLYSDSRVLYMEYTPVQYPYTIEFTYETVTPNTGSIPSWYFLDGFLVSTEKSRYHILYGSQDLKPHIKEKNMAGITVDKTESSGSIMYEAEAIYAIKKEHLSPSFSKIAPKLMVRPITFNYEGYEGEITNWKDMGAWMHNKLLKDRDQLPEATIAKAKSLVIGVTDNLEKAKLIYEYVQENTRYISVQVGIGGIQPISAIEVDRVKYGDCKGLSNYTKALLKAVDVPAFYTHVEAGNDKIDFEDDFADLAQGNHVILAIPYKENYYWIDCTSQIHPFGFIGDFTDGRKVLVIKPDGGEIVQTASYMNEENYQKTEADYRLNVDGSIAATVTVHTKGVQYDNRFYMEGQTTKDIIAHYKTHWDNINNLVIEEHNFKNDKENVVFTEKVALNASNYATKSGDRMLFSVNAFNENSYVPVRYRNRKLPLEIQRGFLDEDLFSIQLPEGYTIEAMPESIEIVTEFGAYTMSISLDEPTKKISYARKLLVKGGSYPKEKYKEYRSFRKKVSTTDKSQIVLIKEEAK